jgi:hypothetical protein
MVMETKFTPGPWHAVETGDGSKPRYWIVQDPATWVNRVAAVPDYDHCDAVANARLIAAAPDLLAALEEVSQWIEGWSPNFTQDDEWPATNARIRAAIAKAEGR